MFTYVSVSFRLEQLRSFSPGAALAGTFGKVISIGGEAVDLALDESRGVLYVADFTGSRIDVISLATNTIKTSINVPNQPSSLSISPDDHWLIVAHYGTTARRFADQRVLADRPDQQLRAPDVHPGRCARWAWRSAWTTTR